jgi:hypothetical protein
MRWGWGELADRIKALSVEQVGALGEALLDFRGVEDLVAWLGAQLSSIVTLLHLYLFLNFGWCLLIGEKFLDVLSKHSIYSNRY